MSGMSTTALTPTWTGHINSAREALILFEACLTGELHHVPRRPHDRERTDLIRSGSVFIYEENASGIKRWTDGVPWSPSRLLGNFLIYRELQQPFPPGEKKRATKKKNRIGRSGEGSSISGEASGSSASLGRADAGVEARDQERALIGSLVDSYLFKEDGLVKKTMSVTLRGISHHLVSYYTVNDVTSGNLITPSNDPRLSSIVPRHDLLIRQNFRAPVDETGDGLSEQGAGQQGAYMYPEGYERGGMMLANSPAHSSPPGHMQMAYGHYPPTAPNLATAMQSYEANQLTSPTNYYHPNHAMPTPPRNPSFDRASQFSQSQTYAYRHSMPDQSGSMAASRGQHSNGGWERSNAGPESVYAGVHSPQQGLNTNTFSAGGSQWPTSPPAEGMNLPPPVDGWQQTDGWSPMSHTPRQDRPNGYSRPPGNGYNGMPTEYHAPVSRS